MSFLITVDTVFSVTSVAAVGDVMLRNDYRLLVGSIALSCDVHTKFNYVSILLCLVYLIFPLLLLLTSDTLVHSLITDTAIFSFTKQTTELFVVFWNHLRRQLVLLVLAIFAILDHLVIHIRLDH